MIRLAVRCAPEQAEAVLAELLALAPGGVEEDEGDGFVEYAIYGAPGELPDLGSLEAVTDGGRIEVSSEEIPDDWTDRWRDFHRPVVIRDRLVVAPSWHQRGQSPPSTGGQRGQSPVTVVVDPGQAFGTGAHATTRMCLELLLDLADEGRVSGPLADWGTGSGVLAIAAAKLGFSPVLACDHERAAIDAARENASANGVDLAVERRNLRTEPAPHAPTAVANLTAPILREVAARLERPPERLVCSGLLRREADEIAAAFAARGLDERNRLTDGDWSALFMSV